MPGPSAWRGTIRLAFQLVAVLCAIAGQVRADDAAPILRVGPGVTPPKLIYKIEPDYSAEGLDAGIQGTVVLEVVVSESGRATNITILSPVGFGLDEKAQAAIEKWRFAPGQKNGQPVRILATIEVNFRLQSQPFDAKA